MTIALREFGFDDYHTVSALWERSGPGVSVGRSDTRDEIAKKLQHEPDLFLVAVESERIVGTVLGGFDGRRGLIYHLAVEPTYRQQGIGKLLMEEIERRLAAKGCLRCYLLVRDDARDVIDFYRRIGWDTFGATVLAKTIA